MTLQIQALQICWTGRPLAYCITKFFFHLLNRHGQAGLNDMEYRAADVKLPSSANAMRLRECLMSTRYPLQRLISSGDRLHHKVFSIPDNLRCISLYMLSGSPMANDANKRNLADVPKVLAVSDSLRAASFSTAILRALSQEEHLGITLTVNTLEDIPLYSEDFDTDPPLTPIAELRIEVQASDGVVIATPEYTHGMPGVLKNALDWASRPAFASCFRGEPVLIITSASGDTGDVRAKYQLRETLVSMLAHVVSGREILLSGVEKRIRDNRLTDADTLRVLARGIQALRADVLSRVQGERA